jgi:prolipoprotein diacylglyceryltransferase
MKKSSTFLAITGVLLITAGVVWVCYCYSISDPEIEGETGRTSFSTYFLSVYPIALGVLLLALSYKNKKKKAEF